MEISQVIKNKTEDSAMYSMYYWVECMTSSVISFAYFAHFSNLNISGTNADIWKTVNGIFFHGILCDTLKKTRGKSLIIVPL